MSSLKKQPDLGARNGIRIKSLAEYIDSQMSPADFFHWLREVMAGRDPDAPEGAFTQPIEFRYRMKAAQMLLERRYGGVPQSVQIEAALTAKLGMGMSEESIRGLPEDKLQELRTMVRAVLTPQKVLNAVSLDVGKDTK